MGTYKNLVKTRYVNDKQITDHYAIIPNRTGTFGTFVGLPGGKECCMTVL